MKRLNQSGAVAMISVVIFSIIITILVSAYARTIISQQREAINYDLSTRAYYAAESGVQDVIRELRKKDETTGERVGVAKTGQDQCRGAAGYLGGNSSGQFDNSDSLAVTCELVDLSPNGGLRGTTTDGVTQMWKIDTAGSAANRILITWSAASDDSYAVPQNSNGLFAPVPQWGEQESGGLFKRYPPVLRIEFVQKNGASYGHSVYFVQPSADTATSPVLQIPQGSDSNALAQKVQRGHCDQQPTGYVCAITFTADPALFNNLYVVMHSIYGETDYTVTPQEDDKPVGLNNIATVDVTARAGNVFRRVQQQVALKGADSYQKSWFNADALVAGDGICKLFSVGKSASQYSTQCK